MANTDVLPRPFPGSAPASPWGPPTGLPCAAASAVDRDSTETETSTLLALGLLPRLTADGYLDPRLRQATPQLLTERFGLQHALPSFAFAYAVWGALIRLGSERPDDQRPGPPRPWQLAELALFLDHSHASLQGARQGAGKTFVAALVIACHLLLGSSVTVSMPTYRQGSSILIRRVLLFMQLLETSAGLRRTTCNAHESAWDNGARLTALSTSAGGRRGTQGFTSRVVVIDESHELRWQHMSWFLPLVALAMKRGHGRLLLLGVGSDDDHAPARARDLPGYASLVLDDATLSQLDALHRAALPPGDPELDEMSWADFFAQEREVWDEEYYRQFYMCQAPGSGQRRIFERVPELVGLVGGTDARACGNRPDTWPGAHQRAVEQFNGSATGGGAYATSEYVFGIDVGKQRDQTVVAILESRGAYSNMVDCVRLPLGMPYTQQGRELAALWRAWRYPRVCIELNGPGAGLCDVLSDPLDLRIDGVQGLVLDEPRKRGVLLELLRDMRRGLFGVGHIPLKGTRVSESGVGYVGTPFMVSAVGTRVSASANARRVEQPSLAVKDSEVPISSALPIFDRHGGLSHHMSPTADTPAPVPAYFGPTIRDHLIELRQTASDDGRIVYDHSDILSALIIARCALQGVVSI